MSDQNKETQDNDDIDLRHVPEAWKFIDKVHIFIADSGWTFEKLAISCGISRATLSQFMSNKYNGNVEKVRKKIADVIEREEKKARSVDVDPDFVDTTISKKVFGIAGFCRTYNELGVCYADAGYGKTESVRVYAGKKSDVILIEANPGYTASVLFNHLSERIGNGGRHTLYNTFRNCVDRLKGSGRLLIIDEAEQLPYKSLEMVRRLHDLSGIGILLIGMEKLRSNLSGYRNEFSQLSSRVGIVITLEPLTPEDTENIVKRKLGDTSEHWKVFHKLSRGNTRRLIKLIRRSIYLSDTYARPIDTQIIEDAASLLNL